MKFRWMLFAATLLMGCRSDVLFYDYQPVNTLGWEKTDTLRFDIPHTGNKIQNELFAGVRLNEFFPYRNINLVVEQRSHQIRHRDTLSLHLMDEKGKWMTSGNIFHELEERVEHGTLQEVDSLQILVYHIMPRQVLEGVVEVGIKVKRP